MTTEITVIATKSRNLPTAWKKEVESLLIVACPLEQSQKSTKDELPANILVDSSFDIVTTFVNFLCVRDKKKRKE